MSIRAEANDRLREFLDNHLQPALSARGWRRQRRRFYFPGSHGYALLELQRSRYERASEVRFFVNVGTYFPAIAALAASQEPTRYPPTAVPRFPSSEQWHEGCDRLLNSGQEVWLLKRFADLSSVCTRVIDAVEKAGLEHPEFTDLSHYARQTRALGIELRDRLLLAQAAQLAKAFDAVTAFETT